MLEVLAFLAGYLAAAVPLGLVVVKVFAGVDIRRCGTGNPGASNIRRNVGTAPAAVVAFGIFLQGLLPPLAAGLLGGSPTVVAAAALGAVVGYGWPVFLRFKGGRGVGVSTGAALAVSPGGFLVLLAAYAVGGIFKAMGLAVLAGFIFYVAYIFLAVDSAAYQAVGLLLLVLLAVRRLEGVRGELGREDIMRVIAERLLFDRRPGQRLTGSSEQE